MHNYRLVFLQSILYLELSGETEAGAAVEQPARDSRTRVNGRRRLRL
jgi:hypothetical protein